MSLQLQERIFRESQIPPEWYIWKSSDTGKASMAVEYTIPRERDFFLQNAVLHAHGGTGGITVDQSYLTVRRFNAPAGDAVRLDMREDDTPGEHIIITYSAGIFLPRQAIIRAESVFSALNASNRLDLHLIGWYTASYDQLLRPRGK